MLAALLGTGARRGGQGEGAGYGGGPVDLPAWEHGQTRREGTSGDRPRERRGGLAEPAEGAEVEVGDERVAGDAEVATAHVARLAGRVDAQRRRTVDRGAGTGERDHLRAGGSVVDHGDSRRPRPGRGRREAD